MSTDRRRPPRAPRAHVACAEDLCDAYEHEDRLGNDRDAESPSPRPRRHAVRLVDELDGEAPPRRGRPVGFGGTAKGPSETEPKAEGFNHRPKMAERSSAGTRSAPSARRDPAGADDRGAFVVKAGVPVDKEGPAVDRDDLPADGYAVLSIHPEGAGETVAVILSVPGEGEPERLKLHLLVEQYAELGVRSGIVDDETADALLAAGHLCAAVKRGMNLLAYGDQSARRLVYKLTAKGVERAVAEAAVAYLSEKGYIHEDDTARRRAEQGVRKQWGPRRIREDLRANGFTPAAIDEALEALCDVDFEAACAAVIRKKYRVVPDDRAACQKLMAALMRLGYDSDTIRAALRRVAAEAGD